MTVWEKCKYKLGKRGDGGDWSDEGTIFHAVDFGTTLCGHQVGSIHTGWVRDQYAYRVDASTVTCKRCLSKLAGAR